MPARAWKAGPHEAEIVARLLVAFRDHLGESWPSDNAFLAGVERLMEDRDTDFLLAAARRRLAALGRHPAALPHGHLARRPRLPGRGRLRHRGRPRPRRRPRAPGRRHRARPRTRLPPHGARRQRGQRARRSRSTSPSASPPASRATSTCAATSTRGQTRSATRAPGDRGRPGLQYGAENDPDHRGVPSGRRRRRGHQLDEVACG